MPHEPPPTDNVHNVLGERRYQGSTGKPPPATDARALQAVTAILSAPAARSKRKRKSSSHQTGLRQACVSSQKLAHAVCLRKQCFVVTGWSPSSQLLVAFTIC